MAVFAGGFANPTGRYVLVASRFNWFIVEHLLGGAQDAFRRTGVPDDAVDVAHVPGSLEIPLVAQRLAQTGRYSAVICLGAIIRGDTDHYDVVVNQSAKGIADASLRTGVPIVNAVLTTHTLEQAIDRAGAKAGNKGFEAAMAAIEMVDLLRGIDDSAG